MEKLVKCLKDVLNSTNSKKPSVWWFSEDYFSLSKSFTLKHLQTLFEKILSENIIDQHFGIIGLRNILSSKNLLPLIQKITEANIGPKLLDFLEKNEFPSLQLESVWVLGCMALVKKEIENEFDTSLMLSLLRLMDSDFALIQEKVIFQKIIYNTAPVKI